MTDQVKQSISAEEIWCALQGAESLIELLTRYPESDKENYHIRVLCAIFDKKRGDALLAEEFGKDLLPCPMCESKMVPEGLVCGSCGTAVQPAIDKIRQEDLA